MFSKVVGTFFVSWAVTLNEMPLCGEVANVIREYKPIWFQQCVVILFEILSLKFVLRIMVVVIICHTVNSLSSLGVMANVTIDGF